MQMRSGQGWEFQSHSKRLRSLGERARRLETGKFGDWKL
jgi:hypothetical protein